MQFRTAVAELVDKCNGNFSEAARRADLSVALISDTINGKGPDDPKTETWRKVYKALGRPAPLVRESGVRYIDKYERLLDWLRTHPDAWPFVLNSAKGAGYKEEP